jgi:hypothetical protein
MKEQYLLRIKKGSPIDNIFEAFEAANGQPLSNTQLAEVGGQKQWGYMFQWLMKMTDNVSIVKNWDANSQTVAYHSPIVRAPQPISTDSRSKSKVIVSDDSQPTLNTSDLSQLLQALVNGRQASSDDNLEAKMVWPQMPPIPDFKDYFRQPDWYPIMERMLMLGKHIALAGPPGVGKDTAIIQLASALGKPLVVVGGDAGLRRKDLSGSSQIVNGTSFFEVAEYAAAAVNGWWVLATEINAAEPDAIMYMNTQMAEPYTVSINGKAYPVHPDFRLIISYNPGLIGTKPLPQSFKDRFFSIQVPFPNEQGLRRILEAHGLPEGASIANDGHWANTIVKFGQAMWDAYERGRFRYQITTRRLIDAITLINNGIEEDVVKALRKAVIGSIDSQVEARAAEDVLRQFVRNN